MAGITLLFGANPEAHIQKYSSTVCIEVDSAYPEDAEALVIRPESPDDKPRPAILILSGQGNVDGGRDGRRQAWVDVCEFFLANPQSKYFYLIVPVPTINNGLVRYTGEGFKKEWAEDAVWQIFTECLRQIGPGKVDNSRLYATGASMGATGVWDVALKYGHMLAAAAPISGQCHWPDDTWAFADPRPDVIERLANLPFRVYQVDCDEYAGSPLGDIEYLGKNLKETTEQKLIPGIDPAKKIPVTVRKWTRGNGKADMELWWVKGPMWDLPGDKKGDDHCLWWRVLLRPDWMLVSWFNKHKVPEERRWRFDSKFTKVDSSERKLADEEEWEMSGPTMAIRNMEIEIESEADIDKMIEVFSMKAFADFQAAGGKQVEGTFKVESLAGTKAKGYVKKRIDRRALEAETEGCGLETTYKMQNQVEVTMKQGDEENKQALDIYTPIWYAKLHFANWDPAEMGKMRLADADAPYDPNEGRREVDNAEPAANYRNLIRMRD